MLKFLQAALWSQFNAERWRDAVEVVNGGNFDRKILQEMWINRLTDFKHIATGVFYKAEYYRIALIRKRILEIPSLCNASGKLNDKNISKDNTHFLEASIFYVPDSDSKENSHKANFNHPASFDAELMPGAAIDKGWLSNTHVGWRYLQLQKFIAEKLTKTLNGSYTNRVVVQQTKQSLSRTLYYIHEKLDELLPLIAGDQSQNLTVVIDKLNGLALLCERTRDDNLFCGKDQADIATIEDKPAGWVQYIAEELRWLEKMHCDYNSNLSLSECLKNCALSFEPVIDEFGDLLRHLFIEYPSKRGTEKREYPTGIKMKIFRDASWERQELDPQAELNVEISYKKPLTSCCQNRERYKDWARYLGEVERIFYDEQLKKNPFVGEGASRIQKHHLLSFLQQDIQKLFPIPKNDAELVNWSKELSELLATLFKFMWEIRVRIKSMGRLCSLENKIGELNLLDIHKSIQADLHVLNECLLPKCIESSNNFNTKLQAKRVWLLKTHVESANPKLLNCFASVASYSQATGKRLDVLSESVQHLSSKITAVRSKLAKEKEKSRLEILAVAQQFSVQAEQAWRLAAQPNEKLPDFIAAATSQSNQLSKENLVSAAQLFPDNSPVTPDQGALSQAPQQPHELIDERQLLAQLFVTLYNYAIKDMSTWGFRSSRLKKQKAILSFVGVNSSRNVASPEEAQEVSAGITDQQCARVLVLLLFGKPQVAANDGAHLAAATTMRTKLFRKRFLSIGPCNTKKKIASFQSFWGAQLTEQSVSNPEVIKQARALAGRRLAEQSLMR